jgi:hypothetical protein
MAAGQSDQAAGKALEDFGSRRFLVSAKAGHPDQCIWN